MTSNFYVVHDAFKAGIASKRKDTFYAAMAPGCGCENSVIANKAKGFYNNSANSIINEYSIYCIWDVK